MNTKKKKQQLFNMKIKTATIHQFTKLNQVLYSPKRATWLIYLPSKNLFEATTHQDEKFEGQDLHNHQLLLEPSGAASLLE